MKSEGSEGVMHVGLWGQRVIQTEGVAKTKSLR